MYPTLYHFFYDWFGVKIQFLRAINSFGFFVAIAFITGAWLFGKEIQRKYREGKIPSKKVKQIIGAPATPFELILNGFFGFLIGFKILYAIFNSEVFNDFPKFLASGLGSWPGALLGAAGMAYWKYYEKKKDEKKPPEEIEVDYLPHQHVGPLLLIAAVFGIIGAKLFAYLENPGDIVEFLSDPFSGLTMYGGLICALIAGYFYFRKHKLPALQFLDAVTPTIILAYGIGRIGCHVAGDGDWGIVNLNPNPGWLPDWLWAYDYPNNVNRDGVPLAECYYNDKFCTHLPQPVYPTSMYETLMCLGIFGILMALRKRIAAAGALFFIYLGFNGVERYLIEQIRVNKPYGFGLNQAEIISLSFIVAGIIGAILLIRRQRQKVIRE
ncbi:MAG TPA: prolipoprotein diacylglyceryl transferase family protein, partial [Flavobacteriales bacterium]|nr:prolipoprotein diacylglyceryl transferase family protein [Flavobacteriales bacterium]